MKLSEAVRRVEFQTKEENGHRSYLPFSGCVIAAFPHLADMDARHAAFSLAFCCPLFTGVEEPKTQAVGIIEEIVPGILPKEPGVHFVCDVIDCLRYGRQMSVEDIAIVIEKIEAEFERRGLSLEGLPK